MITLKLHLSKERGFTLIEVLVSMAILSTSLLAVFGVFRQCSTASVTSQRLTDSAFLAEKLLIETSLEKNISFQTKEGQEGPLSWDVKTSPTQIENLAMIEVNIKWLQQMTQKNYTLRSLLAIQPQYEGK